MLDEENKNDAKSTEASKIEVEGLEFISLDASDKMTEEEKAKKLQELRGKLSDFPIIRPKTEELIRKIVRAKEPEMVLELGTGKGYSGLVILSEIKSETAGLLTIEKDKEHLNAAITNFVEFEYFERVLPINGDAVEVIEKLVSSTYSPRFDLVFLDCNKSSYVKLFPLVKQLMNSGAVLVADNVLYFGKVLGEGEIPEKKHRTIVNNLRKFLDLVKNDVDFENFMVYDVEEGVMIATKK